jgi:hypothetical protein
MNGKPRFVVLLAVVLLFVTNRVAKSIVDGEEQPPDTGGGPVAIRLFAGAARTGRPFAASAYMRGCPPGTPLTLQLPPGLSLVGEELPVAVPPPDHGKNYSQVTWRLTAREPGWYQVTIRVDGTSWLASWVYVWDTRSFGTFD